MPTPVTRTAPAKINLYLHITGKRQDGYHELDSLVAFADFGDVITVEDSNKKGLSLSLSLSLTGPFADQLSTDNDNLVLRAARLLADHTGVPANAHITLEKKLPIASGIGGGSADAAATLRALVDFWSIPLTGDKEQNNLSSDTLNAIGLALGADVPVCLQSRPVFMGGIGEHLEPAPKLPPIWLVLVNPGVEVSTPAVFQARQKAHGKTFSKPARFFEHPRDAAHFADILHTRDNDLMDSAIKIAPVIGKVLSTLATQNDALLTRMSGSGATCFALFATEKQAKKAAKTLQTSHPDWWVQAAQLLNTPFQN